jgi:hypothetical protein
LSVTILEQVLPSVPYSERLSFKSPSRRVLASKFWCRHLLSLLCLLLSIAAQLAPNSIGPVYQPWRYSPSRFFRVPESSTADKRIGIVAPLSKYTLMMTPRTKVTSSMRASRTVRF